MDEYKSQMNRRIFLKQSIGLTTALGMSAFPSFVKASPSITKLTLLHTNDVHSRIDPFPMDGSRLQGLGGVARRSSLIEKIRQKEKNVLLLDCGDMFQGTPYFNMFEGKLELELMSKLGYDAGTFGNHEFDNGISGLVKHLDSADFPFLTANYDFRGTALEGRTKDYIILDRDGVRIGIIGVGIDIEGLVDPNSYKGMSYMDPIDIVNELSTKLKTQKKCDLVLCLSHLGYSYKSDKVSDLKLAAATSNVDIILGGHTHTFLDEPTRVKNSIGKEVWVNQMGFGGVRLGRIDVFFDKKSGKSQLMAQHYTIDHKMETGIIT